MYGQTIMEVQGNVWKGQSKHTKLAISLRKHILGAKQRQKKEGKTNKEVGR